MHRYAKSMLCETDPVSYLFVFLKYCLVLRWIFRELCVLTLGVYVSLQCCVFSAAAVLLESWHVLQKNLWDEHVNHSLILELQHTLNKIIEKNENIEVRFTKGST